ncbi:CapA family protein [Haloarchaeobius sp. TZWWS8]|uniref:CapA family protein n=1 Tax=Haloarchaeobius sp. TZWWS8 TaxID=3446121 RepID=UPI003EBD57C2
MNDSRRAFLTAVGAVAGGGCLGFPSRSPATRQSRSSTTNVDKTPTEATGQPTTAETTDEPEPSLTTIGFGGDTMVGRNLNDIYGRDGVDPASVWGDLQPRLTDLDAVFCNLECCISDRGERSPDRSYYFRGDPDWAVPALSAGNVQFASLANNHAMDFGEVAMRDTRTHLEDAGIEVAGAGENADAARAPATVSVRELDVAVISFSERGYAYRSTEHAPGIAFITFDSEIARTRRVVGDAIDRAAATDPDLLVASVHWGKNWVERPGDRLVEFGHWLVDHGVDLVHGHSAHVPQAVERYGDGLILHDTGDLVDDFGVVERVRNDRSFLFEVTLTDGEFDQVRLVPIHIDDGVSLASDEQAAWLRTTIRARSAAFETTYERDGDGLVVEL